MNLAGWEDVAGGDLIIYIMCYIIYIYILEETHSPWPREFVWNSCLKKLKRGAHHGDIVKILSELGQEFVHQQQHPCPNPIRCPSFARLC